MKIKRKSLLLFILANLIVFGTPIVFYFLILWKIKNNEYFVKNGNEHLKIVPLNNIQKLVLDGGNVDFENMRYQNEVEIYMGDSLENELVFDKAYAPYIQYRLENNTLYVTLSNNHIDTISISNYESYLFKIRLSSVPDSLISKNGRFSYNFSYDTLPSLYLNAVNAGINLQSFGDNNLVESVEDYSKAQAQRSHFVIKNYSIDFNNARFFNTEFSEIQQFNLKLKSNSFVQGSSFSYKHLNLMIDSSSTYTDNFYNLNKATVKILNE